MSELSHQRARLLIQQKQLTPAERRALAAHLGRCHDCRQYAAVHVLLSRDLQLAPVRVRPAPELRVAIRTRVESHQRREQIMNPIRTLAAVAVLAVVVLFAWQTIGSSARQAAVAEPEAATPLPPTSEAPPTRTPRPTLTPLATRYLEVDHQITAPEEMVGTWGFCRGTGGWCFYFQFREDGTWSNAGTPTRERLEDSPAMLGEFWFEEDVLNWVYDAGSDRETEGCYGAIGQYHVQLLTNGTLRFEIVEDECDWRSDEMALNNLEPVEVTE